MSVLGHFRRKPFRRPGQVLLLRNFLFSLSLSLFRSFLFLIHFWSGVELVSSFSSYFLLLPSRWSSSGHADLSLCLSLLLFLPDDDRTTITAHTFAFGLALFNLFRGRIRPFTSGQTNGDDQDRLLSRGRRKKKEEERRRKKKKEEERRRKKKKEEERRRRKEERRFDLLNQKGEVFFSDDTKSCQTFHSFSRQSQTENLLCIEKFGTLRPIHWFPFCKILYKLTWKCIISKTKVGQGDVHQNLLIFFRFHDFRFFFF